jgi:RNA polymerase sigma factor (sigma-70 family)
LSDAADLLEIHRRVLAGEPTASKDLFVLVHSALRRLLLRTFGKGGLRDDDATDLATDTILAYLRAPAKFDPDQASLLRYLMVIASRDAQNHLRNRRTAQKNQERFVELSMSDGNIDEESLTIAELDAAMVLERFAGELTDGDADVITLRLMLAGEKSPKAFADALGIDDCPETEWKAQVKQRRDKLEKRLSRLGDKL